MVVEIHEDQPLVEVAAYVPEGTYGTYNHVWSRNYVALTWMDGIAVNNIGTVYATDLGWPFGFVRTLGGVETNLANYRFWWGIGAWWKAASVTGRYQVGEDTAAVLVEVWRDGAVIWSRNPALDEVDFAAFYLITISPNGEFVAFTAYSVATGRPSWVMLYQGA